jgi:hypothetical protein
MKRTIFFLTALLTLPLVAPAQTTAITPVSAANLGLPGFSSSFGPFFNNQLPNTTARNLNQLLLNLQVDLAQILPVVTAVNDTFDFTFVGTNVVGGSILGSVSTTTPSVSTGTAISGPANTAISAPATTAISPPANLGTSLGQDLSGTGGSVNAVTARTTALGGSSLAITPISTSSAVSSGATGAAAGTASPTFTSRRDVLRALILLQDGVEQMLPVVNGLNGGNATTLNTTTNLTPTGR